MSNMTGSETEISGLYRYATNTVGRPDFGSGYGALINAAVISGGASKNYAVQLTLDYAADSIGFRRLSGSEGWRPFREIWHSGNLNANDLVPPGTVANFARSTPPPGWLKANGAAVSRTSYSALFAAIGTTFGAGDGSTTFNLPDDRGHFTRSWDDGAGVDHARAFGSKQAGTFIASGSGPVGDGITTFAVNPGAAGRNDLSLDAVALADYPNARYTNPGNSSTPNGVPTNTDMTYGAVRPRNIAYLSCIKY
ncbi:MAG: tail fiber protein [Pseudomonadaceae bacterium]|nr:tail fiber protein [Pseudomonadaceae bacterium]